MHARADFRLERMGCDAAYFVELLCLASPNENKISNSILMNAEQNNQRQRVVKCTSLLLVSAIARVVDREAAKK